MRQVLLLMVFYILYQDVACADVVCPNIPQNICLSCSELNLRKAQCLQLVENRYNLELKISDLLRTVQSTSGKIKLSSALLNTRLDKDTALNVLKNISDKLMTCGGCNGK